MDIVASCKEKLAVFRIKELKDVLGQLGLVKQGRKQDLMDRVLAFLSSEEDVLGSAKNKFMGKEGVAKAIDDTFRKMQGSGAIDSVNDGQNGLEITNMKPKEELLDPSISDQKIRCPCGSSLPAEFMIQCSDPSCHVLQHRPCVIIPEDSMKGVPPIPPHFYCEICRVNRSDPFLVTMAHPLSPVKLLISNIPIDGCTNPLQNMETEFKITRADIHLLESAEFDVQAWCILLNDRVPFRLQWPQYADLKINGIPIRTVNRPGSQLLGANGRDDGPSIAMLVMEGFNRISLSGSDARSFCLGVRLVKRRTVQQVLNLIPSEQEGETFADALARVCRCIGGGMAAANEDSDTDLEVISDSVTVNLRCPMSGSRIKTAIRFKPCVHLGCFDLETFVQLNQRSKKWQCPICLKNYTLEDIIVDPYFNRITKMMRDCEEDVTEIDVKPDGSWRAKHGRSIMNLEQWHLADGSLCVIAAGVNDNLEGIAGRSNPKLALKAGIPHNMQKVSSGIQQEEYVRNYGRLLITMSSSASESGKDDGPQSMNLCDTSQMDMSTNDDSEMNSMSYNFDQSSGIINRSSSASCVDQSVIVLSDSDEDNEIFVTPGSTFSAHDGTPVTHLEAPPTDVASLLPTINVDARSCQTNNSKRSDGPFTFPRQPRSVRRIHISIDSDGE